jgi:hypothetical protein
MKRRDILAGLVGVAVAMGIGAAAPKGGGMLEGRGLRLYDEKTKAITEMGFDDSGAFFTMMAGNKMLNISVTPKQTLVILQHHGDRTGVLLGSSDLRSGVIVCDKDSKTIWTAPPLVDKRK